MPTLSAADFRDLLLRIGRTSYFSRAHSQEDDQKKAAALAVLELMERKARGLVHGAGRRPVLHSYSNDITGYLTKTVSITGDGQLTLQRAGHEYHQFLLERSWFMTKSAGGDLLAQPMMWLPRSMEKGKSTWHVFQAMHGSVPQLKKWGHEGISITHYAFDRQPLSSITPLVHGWHSLEEEHRRQRVDGGDSESLHAHLMDWVLVTPCAAHDCANAVNKSLRVDLQDPNELKSLHKITRSLRDVGSKLIDEVPAFVREHAAVAPVARDHDDVQSWWSTLTCEPTWAERLTKLDLHWWNGKLLSSVDLREDDEAMQEACQCLRYLLRFTKFCESRWCTIGPACRALVAALSVGLEALVARIRKGEEKASEWHLSGWDLLNDEVKRFCCVASVSCHAPEAVLLELMEDDRVLLRIAELEDCLMLETKFVLSLPDAFWQRLSFVYRSALHVQEIRTVCLTAAQAAVCFITRRILANVRRHPWSLCLGDIHQNVADLLEEDECPEEPVAAKIWKLGQRGPSL